MSRAQLALSRALWLRRRHYRYRKWIGYREQHPQTPRLMRLRKKWFALYEEAEKELSHREGQIAHEPKPRPSSRQVALAWAASHVGVHEEPMGSNRGRLIDQWERRFGFLGEPWCGIYVGNALLAAGVRSVTSRIASVAAIQEDAEAHRSCFTGYTPGSARGARPGDLVILFGYGDHVEMIRQVNGDGSVETFGGNYSNQVVSAHRDAGVIHGVARCLYP